jgi:5,6-dimethylbenzimidazole synthase
MSQRFEDDAIAAVYRVIQSRRDMREFVAGELPEGLLSRLFAAAHAGPSVGFMQPWRLLHVTRPDIRQRLIASVDAERERTSAALPTRGQEFLRLKVEGLRDCAEIVVVALMDGCAPHIFGRRTLPEMALASAACAIQNMWLAARAEGIGLGWVSIFEPSELKQVFNMPADAHPIAILCIGPVAAFPDKPLLESQGWGQRLTIDQVVFEDTWPADAVPTPTAY